MCRQVFDFHDLILSKQTKWKCRKPSHVAGNINLQQICNECFRKNKYDARTGYRFPWSKFDSQVRLMTIRLAKFMQSIFEVSNNMSLTTKEHNKKSSHGLVFLLNKKKRGQWVATRRFPHYVKEHTKRFRQCHFFFWICIKTPWRAPKFPTPEIFQSCVCYSFQKRAAYNLSNEILVTVLRFINIFDV